jgi:hypothetical protein
VTSYLEPTFDEFRRIGKTRIKEEELSRGSLRTKVQTENFKTDFKNSKKLISKIINKMLTI